MFLWGFTAILGKLISLDTLPLVLARMSIAALGFYMLPATRRGIKILSTLQWQWLIATGFVICIHWVSFYKSIKIFNSSSVVLVCLGTGPMFVLWLEYFINKKKFVSRDIIISLIAFIGMFFLAYGYDGEGNELTKKSYFFAILYGLLASFLASVFTLMNKKLSKDITPQTISFVEMLSGAVLLLIFIGIFQRNILSSYCIISQLDIVYILILGIVCTNIPFLLSIFALGKLKAFTVTLTVNLEPIYGLVIASVLFKEYAIFNFPFFVGAFLILLSVFIPIILRKKTKK